ncbi:tRNA(His) guanylyltransferase 1-like [Phalaenopsis equestris]|uniref:tRNA(His) guanylyltransferase 1-like n=1 Tax=Phalaenopsis equestris TaxID=78828 RepID=UPI0009E19E7F|nr:tRNA(His) guanylyltransferase 1-like [Phalaenopsis equestris]
MANSKYEYVKKFEMDDKLPACNWIIVRIDGHKFHQCLYRKPRHNKYKLFQFAICFLRSFIWKETSQLYDRRASKILSLSVSYFTSLYVIKWKDFFPHKGLKETPCFDGRIVLYPRAKIVRDYLSWRQVDCHINNQYNTCFWMLVKSGKTKKEAQERLKGTLAKDKNELLFQQFGINYDKLPDIFKKGSCVYKDTVEETLKPDNGGNPVKRQRQRVTVGHFNIIDDRFWDEQPNILREN